MNQTSLTIAITTQVAMASFARRSVIQLSTLSHLCLVSHPLVHHDPWMNQTSLTIAITTQVAMASFARRSVIQR